MIFLERLLFLIEHIGNHIQSLPESRHLSCARLFAVSNTRQRPGLPCSQPTHMANSRHTVYLAFAVCCTQQTLGTQRTQTGLCRVLPMANTRHTANSNLCLEQHMAKTEHTVKANPTLTPIPSRQCLPCAAIRHTAKSGFAVCLRHTTNNLSFFSDFTLQIFLLYKLIIFNYILKFHKI